MGALDERLRPLAFLLGTWRGGGSGEYPTILPFDYEVSPTCSGRLEFALAHPIGLTEIAEGTLDGTTFELTSTGVGRTNTGLGTTAVIRGYRVDGDVMRYRTDVATDETPMALHLEAELHRVER